MYFCKPSALFFAVLAVIPALVSNKPSLPSLNCSMKSTSMEKADLAGVKVTHIV
jgi:hypothetical protein